MVADIIAAVDIATIGTAVGVLLVAGLGIKLGFAAYGLITQGLNKTVR